jgi:pyruvate dehydrogenase E2 component (dihydrolipoamide acetyltransferase)
MATEVIMPKLGAVAEESILSKWLVQEGDTVTRGQPLFQAESDKATVDIEAMAAGTVAKLLAAPGDSIIAGQVIALLLAPGEQLPQEAPASTPAPAAAAASGLPSGVSRNGRRVIATPLAKVRARQAGVDITALRGTGPGGRIIEADVRAMLEEHAAQTVPSPPAPEVRRPASAAPVQPASLTGVRGAIARRMSESSHTVARVTLTTEVDAGTLVALRQAFRANAGGELSTAISYDLLMARFVGQALREHPYMNASLTEKGIVQHAQVNVGVAVDTERGLVAPVLKDVPERRLLELAADLKSLVTRALEGKSTPEDLRGGTFTVTNLGLFGIDAFTPIINLPETAILGIGRIKTQPVVRNDQIVVGQTMFLSLAFDHRIVDGAPAARFLQRIARLVETPTLLLL